MHPIRQWLLGMAACTATVALAVPSANATLTLTAAGIADGFSITTFATVAPGNAGCCSGPFGMAVSNNGNVIVSLGAGPLYVFPNSDGQTPGTALFTQFSNSGTAAYATAGGQAYGWQNNRFVQFNNDGTVNHVLTGVTPGPFLGAWGNSVNGHVIASSGSGLIDINPLANGGLGTFATINAGVFPDGISVSPDGLTVYAEQGCINGYLIATGAPTSTACGFNSPDGTGVIIGGLLNGDLIVNNNNGDVDLYDFATSTVTLLATGSSPFGFDRGDYTTPDQKGCLFLAEGDRVDRLCLTGASIGGGSDVPEPASLTLLGVALLGFRTLARRTRG
jgi:hypothetical protein